jgi:Putative zinc- or iron-chelating domain
MADPPDPPRSSLRPPAIPDDQQVTPELRELLAQLVHAVAERPYNEDLAGRLDWVVDVLIARGHLAEGHRRLLERLHPRKPGGVVRLTAFRDKRSMTGPDVDCATLLPLCRGRCCAMDVSLSEEDLAEGVLRWELHQPYLLRKDPATGYCGCLGRDGGCTVYADRPAVCRSYDCRQDSRVWVDFERRIPAPLAPWLVPPGSSDG